MITSMQIDEPSNVEVTMTITMKVSAWRKLRAQLNNDYPGWNLGRAIGEMVEAVNHKFYADAKLDDLEAAE